MRSNTDQGRAGVSAQISNLHGPVKGHKKI